MHPCCAEAVQSDLHHGCFWGFCGHGPAVVGGRLGQPRAGTAEDWIDVGEARSYYAHFHDDENPG